MSESMQAQQGTTARKGRGRRVLLVRQSEVDAAQLEIELRGRLGQPVSAGLRAMAAVRPGAPAVVQTD